MATVQEAQGGGAELYHLRERDVRAHVRADELAPLPGGRAFIVRTDNSPLCHLLSKTSLPRRQARGVELVSRYTFDVEHSPGKLNVADGLSRRPDLTPDHSSGAHAPDGSA
jgi:hypothetical protein